MTKQAFEAMALLDGRTASGRVLRAVWNGAKEETELAAVTRLSPRTLARTVQALSGVFVQRRRWTVFSAQCDTTVVVFLDIVAEGQRALLRALRGAG